MPAPLGPVVAAGAAGILGSMYLDASLGLRHDLRQLRTALLISFNFEMKRYQDKLHIYYRFQEQAKANPDKVYLLFEDRSYTYREMEAASNQLANWLIAQGIKKGDVICTMLPNSPVWYISYYAISKIGAVPAFINNNLAKEPLLHCIKVSQAVMMLFDPVYDEQVATVVDSVREAGVPMYAYGDSTEFEEGSSALGVPALTPNALSQCSREDPDEKNLKNVGPMDPAMLIFTSGTTGMPKAAIGTHWRINCTMWMAGSISGVRKDDVVYCCMPLYHSSALWMSTGPAMIWGATVVLARKFSASRFWDDCCKYNVTFFQYIGELCRYLLNSPPHPLERKHKVRAVFGNGMRPDVWNRFRERFGIGTITEFYGATEGTAGLFNHNKNEYASGAVGRHGPLLRMIRKDVINIRIDPITEEPLLDKDGHCIPCKADEPGELLIALNQAGRVRFAGYFKNDGATRKKVMENVFKKGDMYFRTGDLFRISADGLFWFGDRLGDTFRWHAENVSTTEVAQVVHEFESIAEANVYGTSVPATEGRAGMAALVLKPGATLDFKAFHKHVSDRLPKYAQPVFLRFVAAMNSTGTFKHQKVEFRNQGIQLDKIPQEEQPIYWLKDGSHYAPFTQADYDDIKEGRVKL